MFDDKRRLYILVSIIVALVLVIILVFVFRNQSETPTPTTATPPTPSVSEVETPASPASTPVPIFADAPIPTNSDTPDEQYVQQIARIFVERLGSYSNQNNNQHIEDAKALATSRMQAWLDTQAIEAGQDYAGVTSRVIASSVESLSETEATVRIGTQQYFEGVGAPGTAYQSGIVELVFVDNDWKVSGLFWNET